MVSEREEFKIGEFLAIRDFVDQSLSIAKYANVIKKILELVTNHIDNGNPSLALIALENNQRYIEELKNINISAFTEFEKLQSYASTSTSRSIDQFQMAFPEEISKLGLKFSEGTQHPTYLLEKGLVEIKMETRKKCLTLKTRNGQPQLLGVEADKAATIVRSNLSRLLNRNIEPIEMKNRLMQTSQELMTRNLLNNHNLIKLSDYLKHYQKKYQCLPDEALIDLASAYKSIDILKLDYVKNHEQGYLLYGFESNGYFGFMRIEE